MVIKYGFCGWRRGVGFQGMGGGVWAAPCRQSAAIDQLLHELLTQRWRPQGLGRRKGAVSVVKVDASPLWTNLIFKCLLWLFTFNTNPVGGHAKSHLFWFRNGVVSHWKGYVPVYGVITNFLNVYRSKSDFFLQYFQGDGHSVVWVCHQGHAVALQMSKLVEGRELDIQGQVTECPLIDLRLFTPVCKHNPRQAMIVGSTSRSSTSQRPTWKRQSGLR